MLTKQKRNKLKHTSFGFGATEEYWRFRKQIEFTNKEILQSFRCTESFEKEKVLPDWAYSHTEHPIGKDTGGIR